MASSNKYKMKNILDQTRRNLYIFIGNISRIVFKKNIFITIYCYHSIDRSSWKYSVSKSDFESQMEYLSKTSTFWNLYDLHKFLDSKSKKLTTNISIVTFDDGYQNILTINNIANRFNIRPTVFILSSPKNRNVNELENNKTMLNRSNIRYLLKSGWTIGSHTKTHPDLKKLGIKMQNEEIGKSKLEIEKQLQIKCDFIAYPKGRYDKNIIEIVRKSGYKMAFSMDDEIVSRVSNRYKIGRVGINKTHKLAEFKVIHFPFNIALRRIVKNSFIKYLY